MIVSHKNPVFAEGAPPADGSQSEVSVHPTTPAKILWMCASGALEGHFEDGQCLPLNRGDPLYFDSRLGHAYAYVSLGQQLAKVIGVVTDESGLMREARVGQNPAHHEH